MRFIIRILFFILLCFSAQVWAQNTKASHGILDLRGWNFSVEPTLSLEGEWEFYWNDWDLTSQKTYIHVPEGWSSLKIHNKSLNNYGFVAYRLTIYLPPQTPRLALKLKEIETAYELYLNGIPSGKVGKISKNPETSSWRFEPAIYSVPQGINQLEIVLKISNYVYFDGGITTKITLGDRALLEKKSFISTLFEFFIFGCFFIIGLYHITFYFFRKKDRSPLYFGLFCLTIGIRTLLIGETYLSRFFPDIDFELFFKLDFLTIYLAPPLFVLYFYNLFPFEKAKWLKRIIFIAGISFSLLVILTPAKVFNYSLLFFNPIIFAICLILLFHTIILCIRKNNEAWMLLLGFFIFLLTISNDILFSYHIIQTARISSIGLLLFCFSQALLLSHHISRTFQKVEVLSLELEKQNQELEDKVKGRTHELQKSHELLNQQNLILIDLNATKDKLFSIIAHDLKNPFNGILNFLDLMIRDIKTMKPEQLQEYLELVHKSAEKAYELLENLLEWARIQTGKIKYNPVPILLKQLLKENIDLLHHILHQKNIQIELSLPDGIQVFCDKNMISTVIRNVLTNSIKFTPRNQSIYIKAFFDQSMLKLEITDTGMGIDSENLHNLFKIHTKFSSLGTEGERGTGLGLILCKEFMTINKGLISLKSEGIGKGSTAEISIPLANSQ